MKIEHCEFPDDLLYDPEGLVWPRLLESGEVVVGITSTPAALAGPVAKVPAKPLAASYPRNAAIGFLESGKYFGRADRPEVLPALQESDRGIARIRGGERFRGDFRDRPRERRGGARDADDHLSGFEEAGPYE